MPGKSSKVGSDEYSAEEAKQRFEAALRGALKAPHKPLKEKPKAKKKRAKGAKKKN